ncbi:hypothetical protein HMPREF9318_00179 [Streptococcus urinalis FB127-CNA-2]|uniref:Membrane protein n=1 Tax=Streptococcus urinalis 2285-97 TaxID=764291 RepID=G5KF14_9STRE|nr:DUF1146 family protein [Streptococcus urinalis]EHJ57219.1 putative membrane protein [Streptococcus urinalis 2285-97]EKS21981.1 hypothetical protein HMPREF9318_00179 [Streptococcus urinalis FB127-CNA-2]VEF31793.1 membrane protein [Streptococcus urinalis]
MKDFTPLVTLLSHLGFIWISHNLLISLVNWNRIIKETPDNAKQIRLLIVFISIAIGYSVSHFFLECFQLTQIFY